MARPGRQRLNEDERATDSIAVRVSPAERLELRRVVDETGSRDVAGLIRESVNLYAADCGSRRPFRRRND